MLLLFHMLFRIRRIIYHLPRLSKAQTERLSEYLANSSLLVLGTVIIPVFFGKDTQTNGYQLFWGLTIGIFCFIFSLLIIRRNNEN